LADQERGDILNRKDEGSKQDFLLLVGKAFLKELSEGDTEEAIAYGRAMLVLMRDTHP
jgi:hypothetical protein